MYLFICMVRWVFKSLRGYMINVEEIFVYDFVIGDIGNVVKILGLFLIEFKNFFILLKVKSCYEI